LFSHGFPTEAEGAPVEKGPARGLVPGHGALQQSAQPLFDLRLMQIPELFLACRQRKADGREVPESVAPKLLAGL
jgi:hypothetical protein